jgi:hypothetical protein
MYGKEYRILISDANENTETMGFTLPWTWRQYFDPANIEVGDEVVMRNVKFFVLNGLVVPLTRDTVIARPNHGVLRIVQNPLSGIDTLLIFDTIRDTVSVVKIDPGAETSFSHYPNPTTGKIIVEADEEVLRIDVFDYTGRKVATFVNTNKIDISHLTRGIYTLYLTFKNGKTVPPCEIIKN